ncbi:MAG: hypothetical protein DRR19_29685 [Candidatus Parabeggiatoa sp. nov. 1]|nr:MAG: hypothetical protein DRR19_29685 [Gammaproteobacteria bacterium]
MKGVASLAWEDQVLDKTTKRGGSNFENFCQRPIFSLLTLLNSELKYNKLTQVATYTSLIDFFIQGFLVFQNLTNVTV